MRPYRGKTEEGKWVKGWYCEVGGVNYIIEDPTPMAMNQYGTYLAEEDFIEVIPSTIGQSIGLKDKNGVKIYGGTIAQTEAHDGIMLSKFVYFYDEDLARFRKRREDGNIYDCDEISESGKVIIGNVTDNPELLETKDG